MRPRCDIARLAVCASGETAGLARRVGGGVLVLALVLAAPAVPPLQSADCVPDEQVVSLEDLLSRVDAGEVRYVFVGERHGVGPVKRFAVDLTNALVERGHDVGLYIEGFRTNCSPADPTCWTLARWFNPVAFDTLLREARAPVHAIDPPESDSRGARMAATIAAGSESVRVALVGDSHVRHAGDPGAELRVFGGAVVFPSPGDVARAFPRDESLTIGLETRRASDDALVPPRLRADGCAVDLVLTTLESSDYWAGDAHGERLSSEILLGDSADEVTETPR